MEESVIVSAARTPVGKFGGAFKDVSAVELGAAAIRETVRRSGLSGPSIDLAIIGQVLQGGCGQAPARQATLKAGLPREVPAETLNKVCASSFRAVTLADQIIRAGDAEIVLAGGMESMSNAPYATANLRWGQRMFNSQMLDLMVHDGLWCPIYDRHMAVHGGKLAKEYGVTREEQDRWALRSQTLAGQAIARGVLQEEIVPVRVVGKKGDSIVSIDETPRADVTLEGLAKLPPVFSEDNTVTAGNAPGVCDAGSAILVTSASRAKREGLTPLATIMRHTFLAEDAAHIATAPGNAINRLLAKTGMAVQDIDLFEVNEAFAAVVLVSGKIVGWDWNKVNVNGGAIAFGHAIGATGARIIMTLVFEMRRRRLRHGIAAICSGTGQGDALLVRCD
jgi:acetyl-CoA C-acetyltransferase